MFSWRNKKNISTFVVALVKTLSFCFYFMAHIYEATLTMIVFCISEKRADANGRVYFVNHKNRTTQWEDPRTQG